MNICHSGGAKGADKLFGELALKHGHEVRHYSFLNHHVAGNPECAVVLNALQLAAADPYLKKANGKLDRTFPTRSEYVNNLLRRNFYQVNSSQRVYATTPFDENMVPTGGTSWAIVMAIILGVPEIYNFDWKKNKWYTYDYNVNFGESNWRMINLDEIPFPSGNYAGIGSSELPDNGRVAIESLYFE